MALAVAAGVLRQGLALFLAGLVLKLLDDHLDAGEDSGPSPVAGWGRATAPYLLALFCLAALADPGGALPVFAAGYAIGMANEGGRRLPSGLTAGWEGGLLLGAVALLAGPLTAIWAAALLWSVQAADDYLDRAGDRLMGKPTLITRLGETETLALAAGAALLAAAVDPIRTGLAGLAFVALQALEGRWKAARGTR
ncbi:MAG: hypothetical protein RDU89_00170 [bacterium]|nr:hypothetical protein [bacterium]